MKLSDEIKKAIDDYFENVSDEQFWEDLKEANNGVDVRTDPKFQVYEDVKDSTLTKILKQEPTVFSADTRTLHDIAEERGVPFEQVFNETVDNIGTYPSSGASIYTALAGLVTLILLGVFIYYGIQLLNNQYEKGNISSGEDSN